MLVRPRYCGKVVLRSTKTNFSEVSETRLDRRRWSFRAAISLAPPLNKIRATGMSQLTLGGRLEMGRVGGERVGGREGWGLSVSAAAIVGVRSVQHKKKLCIRTCRGTWYRSYVVLSPVWWATRNSIAGDNGCDFTVAVGSDDGAKWTPTPPPRRLVG